MLDPGVYGAGFSGSVLHVTFTLGFDSRRTGIVCLVAHEPASQRWSGWTASQPPNRSSKGSQLRSIAHKRAGIFP